MLNWLVRFSELEPSGIFDRFGSVWVFPMGAVCHHQYAGLQQLASVGQWAVAWSTNDACNAIRSATGSEAECKVRLRPQFSRTQKESSRSHLLTYWNTHYVLCLSVHKLSVNFSRKPQQFLCPRQVKIYNNFQRISAYRNSIAFCTRRV